MADTKKDVPVPVTVEVAERLVAEAESEGVKLTGPGGLLTDLTKRMIEPPWVSWRLQTLEVRMEHAERDEPGEADDSSVLAGGEGSGGAAGSPGAR